MRRARSAFTLLELLVVLAIIGVLAAITTTALMPLYRQTLVRQGAADIASALQDARSQAQRFSAPVTLTVPNTRVATTFSVTRGSSIRTYTLPPGVFLQNVGSTNTVMYLPPHGTVEVTGAAFRLEHEQAAKRIVVGVTGIAGKVVEFEAP